MPWEWLDEELMEAVKAEAAPFEDRDPNDVVRRKFGLPRLPEAASAHAPALDETEDDVHETGADPTIRFSTKVLPTRNRPRSGVEGVEAHLSYAEPQPEARQLFWQLDGVLTARNPDLVRKSVSTYVKYLGSGEPKCSVVVLKSFVKILLPPAAVAGRENHPSVRDLGDKGRHGHREHRFEINIESTADVRAFDEEFGSWFEKLAA